MVYLEIKVPTLEKGGDTPEKIQSELSERKKGKK